MLAAASPLGSELRSNWMRPVFPPPTLIAVAVPKLAWGWLVLMYVSAAAFAPAAVAAIGASISAVRHAAALNPLHLFISPPNPWGQGEGESSTTPNGVRLI